MMAENDRMDAWTLHAFADGELEAHERDDVERRLAQEPDARSLLDAVRREKAALHAVYDPILNEAVPPALLAAARTAPQARRAPWMAIAASAVFLTLGASVGWMGARVSGPDELEMMSKRALVAHEVYANDAKHSVEVSAAESDQLQTWLTKRIGAKVVIPDLADRGFTFVGGRLLAAEERPAGQLLFEDESKHKVAVFVTLNANHRDVPMQMEQRGNLWGCYWLDGKFGLAVTGDLPKEEVLALAQDVYDQLEKS